MKCSRVVISRYLLQLFGSLAMGALLCSVVAPGCGASDGAVCAPGDQKACACVGGKEGAQACRDDGSGWQTCQCELPGSGGSSAGSGGSGEAGGGGSGGQPSDDDSPFQPDAPDVGSADPCGQKVGEYRGVGSYSNGSTWGFHQCSDVQCQGDFPTQLVCGAPSADGCGGTVTLRTPNGIAYQCVEYARRFYKMRHGVILKCSGNAVSYWKSPDAIFDLKMQNGVTTQLPQPDDVIVFSKGAADSVGHIAVVRKVTQNQVFIIQQNVTHTAADASYPLNVTVDGAGKVTVTNGGQGLGSYAVLGWLRDSQFNPLDCSADGTCPDGYACQSGLCVPNNGPTCGDGIVMSPEQCDGGNLNGKTCSSLGFDGGAVSCNLDCTLDSSNCCNDTCSVGMTKCLNANTQQTCGNYDADSCVEWGGNVNCTCANGACLVAVCGNNAKEGAEVCDGFDLSGSTCQSQGFTGGTLACNAGCNGYNTSGCCNDGCSAGATQCLDANTQQSCGNYDGDSCLEWGGNVSCPCAGAACVMQPDLTVPSFSAPNPVGVGVFYNINVTVARSGGQLTSGTYALARVYLSTDANITTNDYRCSFDDASAQFSNALLNANGNVTQNVGCAPGDVALGPIPKGTYYWGVIVDPTNFHAESNENNNVKPGGQVIVM